MSFLLSFLSLIHILTVRIEWFNTKILVQIGTNIEQYMMIPEAKLYIDDLLVEDPLFYYVKDGVERTFKSTINTNVVKDYILKYRVTFPTYYVSSVQSITFQVIDDVPPTFDQIPTFRIPIGQKLPLLTDGLLYHDNYDPMLNITVNIDQSSLILMKTGTYPLIYQLRDLSGNLSEEITYITIYDHLPPEIIIKKEISLPFGETLSWRDFFTVNDNYDLVPTVFVDEGYIDYNKLGVYPFSITATDSSGRFSTLGFELEIVDLEPPSIFLKSLPAPISVASDLSSIDFYAYIMSVFDNYDVLDCSEVTYYHDIEIDVIGSYRIYYALKDYSGNMTEVSLVVKVADLTAPEIVINTPFIYEVFSSEPHLISQFSIMDNYSRTEEIICKITTSYKMHVVGDYPITIEVTDKAGNKTIYRDYIQIVDVYPPEITQTNDIIITDFEKKPLTYYFVLSDNYDLESHIDILIDDAAVNYEKIGSYAVYITATDASGNQTIMESEVIVIDMIFPILTLTLKTLFIEVGSTPVDLLLFIDSATDNYDILEKSNVLIIHDIDEQTLGVYPVIYQLSDSSKNVTEQILYLSVDDKKAPIINFTEVNLRQGDVFNPLEGIQVEEQSESYTIQYFPFLLDTSIPGEKTVTYVVTDARGNYTISHRIVGIIAKEQKQSVMDFLPVILITLIGAGATYYFWKRM